MLRRFWTALALSTALVAAGTTAAHAAPAIAAVAAFAATPIGGIIVNVGISLASSVVGSLIRQMTSKSRGSTGSGIRGSAVGGDDVPISFILGSRSTAGSFAYRGTWGTSGGTPNAYYVEERILSDLPLPNLTGLWVGDTRVTIDWDADPTPQGYPVLEGRVGGKDHWWVLYEDGSQTAANAYMLAKFGTHPDHPYSSDMVGRGQAKLIFTALVNRDLMTSWPKLKAETDGIALYDPSLDTTAGGDGPQRANDPSTWAPSTLLPVQIYNVLMGIRHNGDWVWGGQGIDRFRLPASSWIAAIAEARANVAVLGGGTEPQFTGGLEVSGDLEPQAVIKELLKGCSGRIAEIGGTYKMTCGTPPSAVMSVTDRDIVITREQGFEPYPVLDQTYNAIRATYAEPLSGWVYKDAPARYSTDLEAEDQGRQLAIDVRFDAVCSATQVQRLMKAAIEDARRFRRHSFCLPPECSELEPLDIISWSSESQGYSAKKFLIVDMDDEANYLQTVSLQEIDPADYDYDPLADELPWSVGQLSTSRPAPQAVSDWAVVPYVHLDNAGASRRPGIKMYWNGAQPDVRALLYQVRLAGGAVPTLSGEIASSFSSGEGVTPAGALIPAQDYEARGKYDPYGPRETLWSDWLPVTTPNVRLGAADISIELSDLADSVATQLEWIGSGVRSALEGVRRIGSLLEEQDLANYTDRQVIVREIGGKLGSLEASFAEVVETALGPSGAIATALSSLYAAMGGSSSQVNVRWQAVAAPAGYSARYAVQAAVNDGSFRSATFMLDVPANPAEKTRIAFDANQVVFTDSSGTALPAVAIEGGELKFVGARAGRISSADGTTMFVDFDNPEIYMEGV